MDVPTTIDSELAIKLTASIAGLADGQRFRMALEIRDSAKAVFTHAPEPRPTRLLAALRKLEASLTADPATIARADRFLWPYLGVETEHELVELAGEPERAFETVRSAAQLVETDLTTIEDSKGGRFRDPRIDIFVIYLAQTYLRYIRLASKEYRKDTRRYPTTGTDPETGEPYSPFDQLVFNAFEVFAPDLATQRGAIITTIRQAVAMERVQDPDPDLEIVKDEEQEPGAD